MSDLTSKTYPSSTPEVAKMLGHTEDLNFASGHETDVSGNFQAENLPIDQEAANHSHNVHYANDTDIQKDIAAAKSRVRLPAALKTIAPYVAVFAVGVFLYFFFFSKVDFSTIFKTQSTTVQTPKESVLAQLEKTDAVGYNAWISQFYYDVSDPKILDPEADNSGNGLTNFQKYLLNLNPKSYDTLGLGQADSQTLAMGLNPLTGATLTDQQKQLVDKYFDMEVIMNRLTLNKIQNPGQVAGASTMQNNPGFVSPRTTNNGNSQIQTTNQTNMTAPVTGADLPDPNGVYVNQSVAGTLQIPSLKITAPLIWTQNPKNFDNDLQSGVVHYPGTALPGQIGTAYISGHSSNYIWAKGNYNHVFTHLGDLADNASFQITITNTSGKQIVMHYIVTGRKQYKPDDIAQFENSGYSQVALSTCWPVGSTAFRLVVYGKLISIDK